MSPFMVVVAFLCAACDAAVTDAQEETCVDQKVNQQLMQARAQVNILKQEDEEIAEGLLSQRTRRGPVDAERMPPRPSSDAERMPPRPAPARYQSDLKTMPPMPASNPQSRRSSDAERMPPRPAPARSQSDLK